MDEEKQDMARWGRAVTIGATRPFAFYLPENPDYSIVQSALDSVRFVLHISDRDENARLVCRSVDATSDGELARYRGRLMEGVGYCADSIFGARMLVRLGRVLLRPELEEAGFSFLDHALDSGFFDDSVVPVILYCDTESGDFLHNLEARSEYVELGHVARVGYQLLKLADLDEDPKRKARCEEIAVRTAQWAIGTERCPNGWYPRRCTPDGNLYPFAPDAFGPVDLSAMALPDPIYDRSGAGALVLELLAEVTRRGLLAGAADVLRSDARAFVDAGGHFGSTNTDTEDLHENVSYALAFQAIIATADVLADNELRAFAYRACLEPLLQFELREDLNGVETKGLLFMEESWNAACTWEMAEAAQAYLVAFREQRKRVHLMKALTILRGLAKHHHGEFGFLTEAVDWDGHSSTARHFPKERYGDIATTHPFLNNLHVLQPTVTFLEESGVQLEERDGDAFYDTEGNRLCSLPLPLEDWMRP